MNIEQITQEVVKELMQEMYLGAAASSPAVPYRRVLILLCRSDLPVKPMLDKLSAWKSKADLQLRAPRWAHSLLRSAGLDASGVKAEFVSFDRGADAKDLVNGCDRVALIGCTRTMLHKIGRMDRDNLPSAVVVEALQRNKPVMLLDDSFESYAAEARKAQDMGVHLGSFEELDRIFPLPPAPQMPAVAARPQAAPVADSASCSCCGADGQCATISTERIQRLMQAGAQRISSALGIYPVPANLASMIDHTLLKPEATEEQVRKLCAEAAQYHFASVCINPGYVPLAAQALKGSGVMVCTVIGFPLGATDTQTKADETRHAVANGADEIDMVINIGALKSRNYQKVEEDIRAVVQAAGGKTVKVILETSLLNDEEKVMGCRLSEKAGAHFVKTATGFGPGGATEADIALMRRSVRPDMEVKASGSIRDQETALKMIKAGATRIGASASVAILKGENAGAGKY